MVRPGRQGGAGLGLAWLGQLGAVRLGAAWRPMAEKQLSTRKEKVACRAAVIQALRFHFHKRPQQIAKLMRVPRQTVTSMTVSPETTVLQWYERRHQEEAIAAALKILEE